jgi:hypothetical protein
MNRRDFITLLGGAAAGLQRQRYPRDRCGLRNFGVAARGARAAAGDAGDRVFECARLK